MQKPRLNTQEKYLIAQLTAEGLTPTAVSKRLGRDNKTISAAVLRPDIAAAIVVERQDLADRFEELNHRLLDSVDDDAIQKINAYQRIISMGVLTDKTRLLRGQSTSNVAVMFASAVVEASRQTDEENSHSPK